MEQFSIVKFLVDKLGLPALWATQYLHVVMSVVVLLIVIIISLMAWTKLRNVKRRLIPEAKGSLVNVLEVVVEGVLKMMEDTVGKDARAHLPLVGSLFIYLLISNLLGVIPGVVPPTDNINTNLACAIVVFFYYNIVGIRKQGIVKYIKHMSGPIIWLAPLMLAIEIISHLVRPVSLSVRLFGNITGDHMVLGIFSSLTPLLIPIIFQVLAIFVAFIQAFVFTLLSVVYISLAAHEIEQ